MHPKEGARIAYPWEIRGNL